MGKLYRGLVFRKIGVVEERVVDCWLLAKNTADRLAVEEFRELEEESVVDSRFGFFLRLCVHCQS